MPTLTSDEIKLALLRIDKNHRAMAAIIGCSREAVRAVRIGKSFKNIHPEIPRWHQVKRATAEYSCTLCEHWRGEECNYGFPDPHEDGVGFAHDCLNYSPDLNQSTSAD